MDALWRVGEWVVLLGFCWLLLVWVYVVTDSVAAYAEEEMQKLRGRR